MILDCTLRSGPVLRVLASILLFSSACHATTATESDAPGPAAEVGSGRPRLCEGPQRDPVRDLFCADSVPRIASLHELERKLELTPFLTPDGVPDPDPTEHANTIELVYLGHSTALSGALVSPINPRAILIGRQTILAYQRGVQQVEIISIDRETYEPNFYLVRFTQACNERAEGCLPGDLYTPRVEAGWTSLTIDDDEALKNAPEDCRQCHQRARDTPVLLMRELRGPWTHFFAPEAPGESELDTRGVTGTDLARDFFRAKGDEPYAGMPARIAGNSAGLSLQSVVPSAQPLDFDSATIEDERGTFLSGPRTALPRSPTWDQAYAAFKRGEQLPLPHFEGRPTDLEKQAALTVAYQRYRAGELPAEALPDLGDIFPNDPQVRAEIGLQTEPGATPAEALIQACGSCHNDVLDQTISRASFNIDLARMSPEARARAIARLQLPPKNPAAMPPAGTRQLSESQRAQLVSYLRSDTRPPEDDRLLGRAAQLGMAGGGRP